MVSSEGGGWNGEAAAGCPAVVVVGVVGAAGRVGVGARGGRVAVRAGAAGAARRAGRGLGASTVTCGTVTVGAAPVGGVSGVVGVSGAGVCDGATPAKQSSISAELLSRSKRLLRIDITSPHPGREPSRGEKTPRVVSAQPGWREAGPV